MGRPVLEQVITDLVLVLFLVGYLLHFCSANALIRTSANASERKKVQRKILSGILQNPTRFFLYKNHELRNLGQLPHFLYFNI